MLAVPKINYYYIVHKGKPPTILEQLCFRDSNAKNTQNKSSGDSYLIITKRTF